ncbi:uncharacterized protein wu:fj19g03 isoform X2 [Corythoichthys intestinalis]|nr:uncharacterized protein LOC130920731 isoform X2 [Corythoichthys intestinalis]
MKLTSAFLFLWLVMLFECQGRTVSRCELRDKLRERITLTESTKNFTDVVLAMLVCHIERLSKLETSTVHICGHRATPTTTTGSTTAANEINLSNETVSSTKNPNNNETSSDGGQDEVEEEEGMEEVEPSVEEQEEPSADGEEEEDDQPLPEEEPFDQFCGEVYDEEGEYFYHEKEYNVRLDNWRKLMEMLNEQENDFDEDKLNEADDKFSADDNDNVEHPNFVKEWSVGYHGLFQLSDSYFCQSPARYSANNCTSNCSAFTDDDITDDLDCFIDSGYWLCALRSVGFKCYQEPDDFFSKCN